MAKPLHLNPRLSDAQRAFVLGVPPGESNPTATLLGVLVQIAEMIAACTLVSRAIRPGSVPEYAENFAMFMAWVEFLTLGCGGWMLLFGTFLVYYAAEEDSSDEMKGKVAGWVAIYRKEWTPFVAISRWAGRAILAILVFGLAMDGHLFLPIGLVAGWVFVMFAKGMLRAATIDAIRAVVPDGGAGVGGKGVAA